jgi:hypothetical protein
VSDEKKPSAACKWGDKAREIKRRDLTEEAAKKAGYPGALREPKGWFRGARVSK